MSEYQRRTPERLIEILRSDDQDPRSWQQEAADEIQRLIGERDRIDELAISLSTQLASARKALEPFAKISLWRDHYPDARKDFPTDRKQHGFSASDVREARAALTDEAGHD